VTADQLQSIGVITIVGSMLFLAAWATSTLLGDPSVKDVELSRWLAVPAHILLLLGLVAVYLVQAHEEEPGVLADSYSPSRGSRSSSVM